VCVCKHSSETVEGEQIASRWHAGKQEGKGQQGSRVLQKWTVGFKDVTKMDSRVQGCYEKGQ
jgi:hypothetical protein